MKKILAIFMLFSLLLGNQAVFASGSPSGVPAGAKKFANQHFKQIVLNYVNSKNAGHYNLTDSHNITFSRLYPVHTMSKTFVTTQKNIAKANGGILKSHEWIAVVYQDGTPKNVIGTFKDQKGQFKFSTFGYGKGLAKELDQLKPSGKLIYEMPTDSWFLFSHGRVSALNGPAKYMLKQKISLGQFRKFVYHRYKNEKVILKNGKSVSVGGNYLIPYSSIDDGGAKKESSYGGLSYLIIGLGVIFLILIGSLTAYKRSHANPK